MLKIGLKTLILLLFATNCPAQTSYKAVDAMAGSFRKSDYPNPETLAKALCKDLNNDRDKARAIFTWVALNMRYDVNGVGQNGPQADSQEEYNEKRMKQAYRSGRGICMDYSLIYQKMAEAVGVQCVFITGNSKGSIRSTGLGDHAWNAVNVDGKWELLDATWGSGHVKDDGKFYAIFQPGYFFTPPHIFAVDHFPEDKKWQLLENPISKEAFKTQANFSYGDPETDIQDVFPFGMPITKATDGKMELRLKINQPPAFLELRSGGRDLKVERMEKDGWLVLRFPPVSGREIQLWGGKENKKGVLYTLMGIFPTR